jgi:hypothetical protein
MKVLLTTVTLLLILLGMAPSAEAQGLVRHELKVALHPGEHRFTATDTVTLSKDSPEEVEFLLHAGLEPTPTSPGVRIKRTREEASTVPVEAFRIILPPGERSFTLQYGGLLHHPLDQHGKEQAGGYKETPGAISEEGVYLSGSSGWYPKFSEEMVSFGLEVEVPAGWDAVSQGGRTAHERKQEGTSVRWESPEPQVEIYLIAAPFTEYSREADHITAMAFLRTPDEGLAGRYLSAAADYLGMYERLIGPYPYPKFALVENFWETGFGMPSFTLLGPKVIRLPFILNTSYPHEILHNWWGNSVYPEYEKGNWSEGLTAYLSDHLMKEQTGEAAEYRQSALQKYADYVHGGRDFPLIRFVSRHSTPSAAVGYGKSLMLFHMLRQELGDKAFTEGLRKFYQSRKFRHASIDDLRTSFEEATGRELKSKFDQWVTREGAPEIRLRAVKVIREGADYVVSGVLEQTQPGDAYELLVPLAVSLEGREDAFQTVIPMNAKRQEIRISLPARALRIDVDPEFDLFRRLDREEIPPALTQGLGAKKMLVLLPSSAGPGLLQAYRELASDLSRSGPDELEIRLDSDVKELPRDRAVALIGWGNRFTKEFSAALSGYDVHMGDGSVRVGEKELRRESHSVVLTARLPKNREHSLIWIASDLPKALPGLGRKLPHYQKYSYVGFEGQEPANVLKGRWPVLDSPMTILTAPEDARAKKTEPARIKKRKPLATLIRYPSYSGSYLIPSPSLTSLSFLS